MIYMLIAQQWLPISIRMFINQLVHPLASPAADQFYVKSITHNMHKDHLYARYTYANALDLSMSKSVSSLHGNFFTKNSDLLQSAAAPLFPVKGLAFSPAVPVQQKSLH